MIAWDYHKSMVRVDLDSATKGLSVDGVRIVVARVQDDHLVCEWDSGWKVWEEMHQSIDFLALQEKVQLILQKRTSRLELA